MKTNKFIALVFVAVIFSGLEAHAQTCGQLAGVRGPNVEVLRLQRSRTGGDQVRYGIRIEEKKVVPLECDDVVLTGRDSSARIILATAKLSLGPESRIEIAAHTKSSNAGAAARVDLLSLTYGKVRALVNRKKSEPPPKTKDGKEPQATFKIKTYTAVAGVRGTDFYVSYDPNSTQTEQATIEGLVEVERAGAKQSVLVEAGQQVNVDTAKTAQAKEEPLKVVPLRDSVRNEIRLVSAAVRDDQDFTHKKAVETLGKPETWVLEREKVPENLKDIQNEY